MSVQCIKETISSAMMAVGPGVRLARGALAHAMVADWLGMSRLGVVLTVLAEMRWAASSAWLRDHYVQRKTKIT